MNNYLPNFDFEKPILKKGFLIAGIDEVGRGSLAGPLTFAAVCFKTGLDPKEIKNLENLRINDSKKLSAGKREKLSDIIKNEAFLFSIVSIGAKQIDKLGITKAGKKAVRKLAFDLRKKTNKKLFLLIDAFYVKYVRGVGIKNQKAIIHGDQKSISIAAASILAKVYRDKLMEELSRKYPEYGFDRHKGYGTKSHRLALKKFGPSKIHRLLFLRKLGKTGE